MGISRFLSEEEKWFIVLKRKEDLNLVTICQLFETKYKKNIPPSTVSWSIMKMKLWDRREEIHTKDDTWKLTKQLWFQIKDDLVRKIYHSLPERCQEVTRLKGQRIKKI